MYKVEYADVHMAEISANNISNNLFAQVDQDGIKFALFNEIIIHRKDGIEIR